MEFNAEQLKALESFIKKEVSNKMLMDKIKHLKSEIEHLIERDGWRLESRIEKMFDTNEAFIVEEPSIEEKLSQISDEEMIYVAKRVQHLMPEQPMPEPDANHVDDPEQLM